MAFAHHQGVGLPGSTMAIMAPSGGPLKTAGLQGKCRSVWGPSPLGAAMDSSGLCLFHGGNKYCHNGGMAGANHLGGIMVGC
jgi:hypothetical protein